MNYYIHSNDGNQSWSVPKWFYDFWQEVHYGPNRSAYDETISIGNGKNYPFTGTYNYLKIRAEYVNYRSEPPKSIIHTKDEEKIFRNKVASVLHMPAPTHETYCNFSLGTCAGFLGRKDIERIIWTEQLSADKIIDQLKNHHFGNVRQIILPAYNNCLSEKSFIVACTYGKGDESGHVAPIIGYGTDGKLYCCNKGSRFRDGVRRVDGLNKDSAFYANLEDILFFEVMA